MRIVSTFANHAEAGFYQSLLQNEGIESFIREFDSLPAGAHSIEVSVHESDHERAVQILAALVPAASPKRAFSHPAQGFPFLGILGLVTIIFAIGTFTASLLYFSPAKTIGARLLDLIGAGIFGLVPGAGIGFFVALLCLICRPLFQKIK
jgi:hypothetical protein